VIDHDQISGLRLSTGSVHIAVLRAAENPDAVKRIGSDPSPEDLLAALHPDFGSIPCLCPIEPGEDLELESQLLRIPARLSQISPPAS
jgi:hypothetical protein